MEHVDGGKGLLRTVSLILGGILALYGCFSHGKLFCEAKEPAIKQEKGVDIGTAQNKAAADEEQEIIEFITAYYKAQTPEGLDTLADYVEDPQNEEFQRDVLRRRLTFEKGGVKGWKNIKAMALPLSDGKHWVVSVSSDLIVEGIDVGIPGGRAEMVGRNDAGELKIIYDTWAMSDTLIEEIRELMLTDEIVEHNNETAAAYNALIAERPDIMEWALETNTAVDEAWMEALAQEESFSEKTDSEAEDQEENTEEKPDVKNGSYTVQKGDCLWDIAEKQLGDGMRWSELYEQNKEIIGEDPDLLYVGIVLQLN